MLSSVRTQVLQAYVVMLSLITLTFCDPTLDALFTKLWQDDPNRLDVGKDIILNWQGVVTNSDRQRDISTARLCSIRSQKITSSPTYTTFIKLLDNYNEIVGESEVETVEEKREIDAFISAVAETATMKKVHEYLSTRGMVSKSLPEFSQLLRSLWFKLYRRLRPNDSSAFEHVFIGESKNREISGFHNWLTFCLREQDSRINYHGYFSARYREPAFKRAIRFSSQRAEEKQFGSILFGASVEFEMGLYTTAFLVSRAENKANTKWPPLRISIGRDQLMIQCHDYKGDMGSCYVK